MYKFSFLLISFLAACTKVDVPEEFDYTVVELTEITDINQDGITIEGMIHSIGDQEIILSGFSWQPLETEYICSDRDFFLPVAIEHVGKIEARIDRQLIPEEKYRVNFIVKTESGVTRFNEIEFESKGSSITPVNYFESTPSGLTTQSSAFFLDNKISIMVDDAITSYDTETNSWMARPNTMLYKFRRGLQFDHAGWIYSIAFRESSTLFLWRTKDLQSPFEEYIPIPDRHTRDPFYFIVGDNLYMPDRSWNLKRISLKDPTDTEIIPGRLPFPGGQNYIATVDGKAYVLHTDTSIGDELYFNNELFQFDPASKSWIQLANYPGTGKETFTVVPGESKYLYVGLGTIGNEVSPNVFKPASSNRDIWRLNTETLSWELIGWGPESSRVFPATNIQAIQNKIYMITGSLNRIRMIVIDPEQLSN